MDSKYNRGKIYKIYNSINSKCYIGSTIQSLNIRFSAHKQYKSRNYSSKLLFEEDELNCKISLIELYPCHNKHELHARERYWIEKIECVNQVIPTRTKKERNKEGYYNKMRYLKNLNSKRYLCKKCNTNCRDSYDFKQHVKTQKHIQSVTPP